MLQISSISRHATPLAATLTFSSVSGVTYEVWASPDLKVWQQLDDEVIGTGSVTEWTDTFLAPANPRVFYQVRRL